MFEFQDYKTVIQDQIKANAHVHGYKGLLAEAAGCQRAYLSQVLNTKVNLTPDHAAALSLFWNLSVMERDYFMGLVDYARAATPVLRRVLNTKLTELRSAHTTLTGRIRKPKIEQRAIQQEYYSAWQFSAIHILLTIREYRSPKAISQRLALSEELVLETLSTLEKLGLARNCNGQWQSVTADLHLPQNSPMTTANHLNWRLRAVQDSQQPGNGLHFTAVYSMAKKDMEKIKTQLLKFIAEMREDVLKSPEEELVTFTCDFFATR